MPEEARWDAIQAGAGDTTTIGRRIDDAMDAIERENASLKGVLPKTYARQDLDKTRLAGVINLIGKITLGNKASRSKDLLGRVYEYFLARFASAESKSGGEFYTPSSVVRLLVEMINPWSRSSLFMEFKADIALWRFYTELRGDGGCPQYAP